MLEDIEDLTLGPTSVVKEDVLAFKDTYKESLELEGMANDSLEMRDSNLTSFLPGRASVHIRTWGCTHNTSDSEYMAGLLSSSGYTMVEDSEMADVWLLNSCTVKSPSEARFRNAIEMGKSKNKVVVVAGCVPQGRPGANYLHDLNVVGVNHIGSVVDVVEAALQGTRVRMIGSGRRSKAELSMPKVRRNALIEIVAINSGCLNRCTYCKTKHARGNLRSHPVDEIVHRVRESIAEGVVEIWLTSEDTGAYGRDIDSSLPILLESILAILPSNVRLRLGMTNPPYIMEHLDEMAELLKHPQMYRFIHVPMQSGSDSVLKEMRREYNRDEFCRLVDKLSLEVDGIHIATDVICGFPTETEEDFEQTIDLCRRYRFNSLFINQFYPRPGTSAAKMVRVCSAQEVKNRTKKLAEFFRSYTKLSDDRIGSICQVLITDFSHDKKFLVGHTICYEQVLLDLDQVLMGKMVDVRIIDVSKFYMRGELLSEKRDEEHVLSRRGKESSWNLWYFKVGAIVALVSIFFSWLPLVFSSKDVE